MKLKYIIFLLSIFVTSNYAQADCVILLHGLARSADSMQRMEKELNASGYNVVNIDYPSQTANIKTLASEAIPRGLKDCVETEKVHFVTHSLGGILVRQYLSEKKIETLGRVVMLGPPNKGSQVVDKLGNWQAFKWLNGPAGQQLGTNNNSIPNTLGKVDFDLGIIAGSQSINLILSYLIPGKDDGKVSIENTKVEGMKEHIVMSTSHPFMMKNKKVIEQVKYYLQHGSFKKN